MQRKLFGIGAFLIAAIAIGTMIWFSVHRTAAAPAPPLSQADIETKAVAYAQQNGLQGTPTSITSKLMTMAEFNVRLDPFSNDSTDAATQVWLVVMKGNFAVANPQLTNGDTTFTKFDNGWVSLSTNGTIIGRGNQAPGYGLDLNVPAKPLSSWPTQENQKK
jgi:hypothetical protein